VRIRRVAGRQASRPLLIGLKVGRMLKSPTKERKKQKLSHKRQNKMSLTGINIYVLQRNQTH